MSYTRWGRPFYPLENSTAPSFNSTTGGVVAVALQSTVRIFQGPSNRAVRVLNGGISSSYPLYIKFGASTVVAAATDSLLVVAGWPTITYVTPSQTYISLWSSTDAMANITLGYGG